MQENPYLTKVTRTFQELEVIFEEGSDGDEMYIVHSGAVKLVKTIPAGEDCHRHHQTGGIFWGNGAGG